MLQYIQLTTSDTIFILYIFIYYCEIENCVQIILLRFYDIVSFCRLYIAKQYYYSCKKKRSRRVAKNTRNSFCFFYRLTKTRRYAIIMFIKNTLRLRLRNFYARLVTPKLIARSAFASRTVLTFNLIIIGSITY